jgi:hypothetical protein
MKEALSSSETSILTKTTQRNIPKDVILLLIFFALRLRCFFSQFHCSSSLQAICISHSLAQPKVPATFSGGFKVEVRSIPNVVLIFRSLRQEHAGVVPFLSSFRIGRCQPKRNIEYSNKWRRRPMGL